VGIERTFAIQELTLPLALAGDDLIGQARTGTGKTLGFGVPLIQRITTGDIALDGTPRALVVVPISPPPAAILAFVFWRSMAAGLTNHRSRR
jgi:superfamily II DNA/RNA helicase